MVQYEVTTNGKFRVFGSGFNEVHDITEEEVIAFVRGINDRLNGVAETVDIIPPEEVNYEILDNNRFRIYGGGFNYILSGDEASAQTELIARKLIILENSKEYALAELRKKSDVIYKKLLTKFSSASQDSFLDQRTEVLAWLKDDTISTPFIDGLATGRGIDRLTLIDKIMTNINIQTYSIGRLQYYEQLLKNSTNIEDVNTNRLSVTLSDDINAFIESGGV